MTRRKRKAPEDMTREQLIRRVKSLRAEVDMLKEQREETRRQALIDANRRKVHFYP